MSREDTSKQIRSQVTPCMPKYSMPELLADKNKRARMWRLWQEKQSLNYVAKLSDCSIDQVKKVRKMDDWDRRLKTIQERARQIADANDTVRLVKLIEDVANIRQQLVDRLKAIYTDKALEPTIADLDRIVRLEQFLKGQPDSRPDQPDPFKAIIMAVQQYDAQRVTHTPQDRSCAPQLSPTVHHESDTN